MPIVDYTPERFGDVSEMVSQFPGIRNLAHRSFVNYYYSTREWSKLYLYYSDSGKLIGTLGRDLARFEYNSRELTLKIGSNWYSLQRGVGGELSEFSAQSNPDSTGLMVGGSQDTRSILRHHNWIFMPGIRGYFLTTPATCIPENPSGGARPSRSSGAWYEEKSQVSRRASLPMYSLRSRFMRKAPMRRTCSLPGLPSRSDSRRPPNT